MAAAALKIKKTNMKNKSAFGALSTHCEKATFVSPKKLAVFKKVKFFSITPRAKGTSSPRLMPSKSAIKNDAPPCITKKSFLTSISSKSSLSSRGKI